ncbi:MAG: hypothetical protein HY231_04695 [Acidobacteria bacterium]|nr:hypothetical protein [Acidobacteriota bacterium]
MTRGRKLRLALFLNALGAAMLFAVACHAPTKAPVEETLDAPTNEPETYAATIVCSIEDGEHSEVTETRVMRAGDLRRAEWTEGGQRLALITRYDTGKTYLLNLDKQIYSETDSAVPERTSAKSGPAATPKESANAEANRQASAMDFVEDDFSEAPLKVENRTLPDEYVANQLCQVFERHSAFADGRIEMTKTFRAVNLSGLAVKTESESLSSHQHLKITTEWRDLKLAVASEAFNVPTNFKLVADWHRPTK